MNKNLFKILSLIFSFTVFIFANSYALATGTETLATNTPTKNKNIKPELKNKEPTKPVLVNQIIAIVNKQVITSLELEIAVKETKERLGSKQEQINDNLALKRQVLQNLINKKIALQIAKNNNIVVSSLEVSKTIDNILNQNRITLEKLKMKLRFSGISYKSYRENIRNQITISKLQQQAVSNTIYISPQDIETYIQKHTDKNNIEYKLEHILLPLPSSHTPLETQETLEKAKKLVSKIESGEITFSQAAIKYSQSADALDGGNLGFMSIDSLPTIFAKHVKGMKEGGIVGPYQAGGGIQIIKLVAEKSIPQEQHFINQYEVQQIKINLTPVVNDEQAKDKLNRILISLKNGETFSNLAKSNSQNYDTASNGGNLGWVTLQEVSYEMGEQIKSLPDEALSEPFRDGRSWEIIKILGQRQKNDTSEYLKQQASNVLFQLKAKQALKSWMASLRDNAFVKILIPDLKIPTV